jgi:hypothetical protein
MCKPPARNLWASSASFIKTIAVTTAGNSVKVYGKLHVKGDFPFETEDTPVTTPEGHIRNKEQLVAGYTKITPDFELRVFMRDFNKVQNQLSPRRVTLSRQSATPHR